MATSATSPTVIGNPASSFWLFDPSSGYDLTHPSSPDGPPVASRLTMATATMPVTIATEKTALVVIDMQNFFLSPAMDRQRGAGHVAADMLLSTAIPAARKAGIRIVYVNWGISDEELAILPPVLFRGFGFHAAHGNGQTSEVKEKSGQEVKSAAGVGDDIGQVTLPDGSTVSAGRKLMRDQWNTALHDPLKKDYEASQKTALPDALFHKNRVSGFWGGSTPCLGYLREHGITTLLFAGVNTDQCVLGSLQDACNMGFDTVLLRDGCGTTSPGFATEMVEYNCRKSWGFLSDCKSLAEGVASTTK